MSRTMKRDLQIVRNFVTNTTNVISAGRARNAVRDRMHSINRAMRIPQVFYRESKKKRVTRARMREKKTRDRVLIAR